MSVVAALPYEDLVVMGMDTRVVDASRRGRAVVGNDWVKLRLGRFGWVAGVGHHGTLEAAAKNLDDPSIANVGDVKAAFAAAWHAVLKPARASHPEMGPAFDATHLMISMDSECGPIALCYSPSTYGAELKPLGRAGLSALGPTDVDPAELKALIAKRPMPDPALAVAARAVDAVGTVAAFIYDVASRSADISNTADIGVHGVAFPDGKNFYRFRGPAGAIADCVSVDALRKFEVPALL